jgi:hypothetical protein
MWRIFRAPLEAWVEFVWRGLVVPVPMFPAWVFKKGIAELLCIHVFTASQQEEVNARSLWREEKLRASARP